MIASPHHGSSVLSSPEFVQTVQHHLGLKWKMAETLRQDFSLQNKSRELLNYKFSQAAIGIKIYSYVEKQDTRLQVLSTIDTGGESIVEVNLCVVDNRSAKLGNVDVPVEEEEVIDLNCTHTGVARFTKEENLQKLYIDELVFFIESFSVEERTAYDKLNDDILNDVRLDVHQFYQTGAKGELASTKIISGHPSLKFFFDFGPTECLRRRLETGKKGITSRNGVSKPAIRIRHPSEPANPVIKVHAHDDNIAPDDVRKPSTHGSSLAAPTVEPPGTIHTRRPSVPSIPSVPPVSSSTRRPSLSVEDIPARQPRGVQFAENPFHITEAAESDQQAIPYEDSESGRRPQRSVTYQLPSAASNLFRWVHVPWNHTGWVPHVLTTISREKENLDLHKNLLLDQMWLSQHNRSRHASPHARFVRPSIKTLLSKQVNALQLEGSVTTPRSAVDDVQLVLYMPYLHWDSFQCLQNRARVIKKRRDQTRARPVDPEIAGGSSMENKLIWQYLMSDLPLHCRRTLDQFGYPSLRNTSVRDGDQVLYKRTKADKDAQPSHEYLAKQNKHMGRASARQPISGGHASDGPAKVLMVDQLWLWVLDGETVVTFASPKETDEHDGGVWKQADLVGNIYQDINGDYARQCADPFDFAALAVFHAVKALLDHTSDLNLQVFRIFEEYISILTERQTVSFKEFRNNNRAKDPTNLAMKRLPRYFDNTSDLDALLELRDIEDELNTLDKLFKEQQKSVQDMVPQYQHLNEHHKKGIYGTHFLQEVKQSLDGYKEQIDLMLKSAQTAQKAYKELLDMKQKQANVDEAHLTREQTEVATDQSRSIMIFTIFTIIFLPLSFFASVFGINAREWSGTNTNLSLHSIFLYMGTISLAVIIVALLVAFNKFTRKITQRAWKRSAGPMYNLYWSFRRRPPPPNVSLAIHDMTVDLEKWPAIDTSWHQTRLPSVSRAYAKMDWEEEMGPRGYG